MARLAILMDPIETIDFTHDSSLAMLLAAREKGWDLYYFQAHNLYADNGKVFTEAQQLNLNTNTITYQLSDSKQYLLSEFDVVLMRKDPPFNMEYIYLTYLLEQAEYQGAFVVNKPQSLRDANEKMFTLWFPEHCAKTLVSADASIIKNFWQQQGEIILKPLDGMGGSSVFFAAKDEPNINVIIETLTHHGNVHIMAQQYIPAIKDEGDKRIILINGQPVSHALARIPAASDIRGNMAAGAKVKVVPLTKHEQQLCAKIGLVLQKKGLVFVGLDVIGSYVTEINVTSPTGIQELDRLAGLNIAGDFINYLQESLNEK